MSEREKRIRTVPKNVTLIREAVQSRSLFFLLEGSASVRVDGKEVHRIRKGEFFGEIAPLLGTARTADVVTNEESRVLEFGSIDDHDLSEFLRESQPQVLRAFLRGLAAKLVDSSRAQRERIRELEQDLERLQKDRKEK